MLPAEILVPNTHIKLKLIQPADKVFFMSLFGDQETMRFIHFFKDPAQMVAFFDELCDYTAYREKTQINYVVFDDQQKIGIVGLVLKANDTYESGTVLAQDYQGKGLTNVIRKKVYTVLFNDCHADRIISRCNIENQAANKINSRFGMRLAQVVDEPEKNRQMNIWSLDKVGFAKLAKTF